MDTYKQWNGNVVGYEVFRSINGVFSTIPIAIISSSNLYYEDDISGLIGTNANGNFCYYIEAIEGVNSFGTNRRSRSNEVCVNQEPLIFVPNALYIDGYNSIWKPVINMIDVESYSLNIYSRMGKSIFESSDINAFWDGKHKGEYVPFGVYIYHINYQEGSGGYGDLRGTITVIR
jgi:gliding motility-associated-like protein